MTFTEEQIECFDDLDARISALEIAVTSTLPLIAALHPALGAALKEVLCSASAAANTGAPDFSADELARGKRIAKHLNLLASALDSDTASNSGG